MFLKLKAALCMPQEMLNKLPVAITLPFPIGTILIGPFPGTPMKEKAICAVGFWLWHWALTDSMFSPSPHPLISRPLHPSLPGPFTPLSLSWSICLLSTLHGAAVSVGCGPVDRKENPRILLEERDRKVIQVVLPAPVDSLRDTEKC